MEAEADAKKCLEVEKANTLNKRRREQESLEEDEHECHFKTMPKNNDNVKKHYCVQCGIEGKKFDQVIQKKRKRKPKTITIEEEKYDPEKINVTTGLMEGIDYKNGEKRLKNNCWDVVVEISDNDLLID